tara:strand:+ start:453 stop:1736 length:1284 start_codon:yes stop_codon:yes gene_type:complete
MGKFSKAWKAVTSPFKAAKKFVKNIKKPFSKITKGIARGIAKMAKVVMKGVGQLNKKLGPIGMLGLAIAMPYAMQGLSNWTTMATQSPQGTWLNSVGKLADTIRTGYRATTGAINNATSFITESIGEVFSRFGGNKGNIFTRISNGAKELYRSAQQNFAKVFGKKGSAGKVEVWGKGLSTDGPALMDISAASDSLIKGTIDASQLGKQTVGTKAGWLTQELTAGQRSAAELVTNTINDAYKSTLDGYSKDALRYFNDIKNASMIEGSYINDAEIAKILDDRGAIRTYDYKGLTDYDMTGKKQVLTDIDFRNSPDYKFSPQHNEYIFTGDKSFSTPNGKNTLSKKIKKSVANAATKSLKDSLLTKADYIEPVYEIAQKDMTWETSMSGYEGTNQEGSAGGSIMKLANFYNDDDIYKIRNYYKHMNLRV